MFKKRKVVRKIVTILIAVIMILGLHIKFNKVTKDMYAPAVKNAKAEENVGLNHGTINPIYKPKWEKVSSAFNATSKTLTVTVKGSAYESKNINDDANINYASDVESTLEASDITVLIDGVNVTNTTNPSVNANPTVDLSEGTTEKNSTSNKNEITYTIVISNLEQATREAGKNYKEWSGNIALKLAGRGKDSSTYNANVLTDEYGNQNMMEKDTNGTWLNVEIKDTKTDHNTDNTMFADYTKPEITYVYADSDINYTDKKLTVEFSVTDKYFKSTKLLKEENGQLVANQEEVNKIGISLKDEENSAINSKVTKRITNITELTEERDGETVTIGYKFTMVISGLQQNMGNGNYRDYSGPMSIAFPEEMIEDKSENKNEAKTITIGVNDPDNTGSDKIVDVVDPIWEAKNVTKKVDGTTGKMTVTMDLYGTDKYYDKDRNALTAEKIQLWVDGVDITASGSTAELKRTLTKVEDLEYGIHYKFELSGIEETDAKFNEQRSKYETNKSTGRVYREYSGDMKVIIPRNTLFDKSDNSNKDLAVSLNHIDTLKPEIIKVSSTKDTANKKETFIFDVVDKYLANTILGTTVEEANANKANVKVYLDGEEANSINKNYVKVEELKATINKVSKTVGYRYTLELTKFEENPPRTTINFDREYSDWSGTVSIKFAEGTATDTEGNRSDETTLQGDFVDFIKPNITYQFATADINKDDKTFTMVFDMTDKFYDSTKSTKLDINDLTIKIDGKDVDWTKVSKSLNSEPRENTVKITENGIVKSVTKVIGWRYTLKLSDLEQLQVKEGEKYLDYSGVITVAIPANKMVDTSENKNDGTSLTSGISIPGGTSEEVVVDVVDPLFEKVNSSAHAINKTATLNFKVTDKYFKASTLTKDNIKIFINGTETKTGLDITLSGTAKNEQRTVNNKTSTVPIGMDYALTIKNFSSDVKQVKVVIPEGVATDKSDNGNKETEFILYNTLKATYTGIYNTDTNSESRGNAPFLGNTNIQRQNIDNITFVNNIPDNVKNGTTTWDVSAQQDKSILAWYDTNANGSLKVYIGSNNEIFANQDSTDLFSFIGYSNICTSTETIKNINLLNVKSVTNMMRMFRNTGYNAMNKLELGSQFDTSNVTDMSGIFGGTGYNAMETLNLGDNFNTGKVKNMAYMFSKCGYTKLSNFSLGNGFNTSDVEDMSYMFSEFGNGEITSLNLGANFNTTKVKDMSYMFYKAGKEKMETLTLGSDFNTASVTKMPGMFAEMGALKQLNLGTKFNTASVTNMEEMFNGTGNGMTSFDLGDNFYTTNVTNMKNMFLNMGQTGLETLDLGPAFTNIAETNTNMFKNTGKSGTITIYASEQIYQDKNNFKLNTDATNSAINYTRGTINPKYRTEWIKEASELTIDENNINNSKITVTLRGRTNNDAGIDHTSDVTSLLTPDDIQVFIDGKEATSINKALSSATAVQNPVTKANDVTQVLTISNLNAGRIDGKSYQEWSGNITLKINKKTLKDKYDNRNLSAIDTSGKMTEITIHDEKTDTNSSGTMFIDSIKPEFTYRASDTKITHGGKEEKVEITFDITDKYFDNTTLKKDDGTYDESKITVKIDDYDVTELNNAITKKLEKVEDLTDTVNGEANVKIGERLKLTITGLDSKNADGVGDGFKYSGYMTLAFAPGTIYDKSGNQSSDTSITIGRNEPGGSDNDKEIVDVVDPVWTLADTDMNGGIVKIRVKDKFLIKDKSKFNLTIDDITVLANGTPSTEIGKRLTGPVEIVKDQEYEYTLILSNITPEGGGYTEFTPTEEIVGGTAKYKNENGGNISIEIAAGVVTDAYQNSSNKQLLKVGFIDGTGPEVYEVQKTQDKTLGKEKETIIFNVTDKNYDPSDTVTVDEISIWIDGELADSNLTKKIVKTVPIKTLLDGEIKTVGHQYTVEITDMIEKDDKFKTSGRDYRELSGTLELKISENASRDTRGNRINPDTTTISDFVDFIKPEVRYKFNTADIDRDGKTFTMEFDIVDKYWSASTLDVSKLGILIDNEEPNWDEKGVHGVTKKLTSTEKKATINGQSKTIGRHYVLKLSHLEQLEKLAGKETMDYSGIITVAIPEGVVTDTTNHGNAGTTITSGINILSGDASTDGTVVDVVDPIWERVSSTASAANQTASITVKGTDKYFNSSNLTANAIKVFVNGTDVTDNVDRSITGAKTPEYASDGTTRIGDSYTISLSGSGLAVDANQIKVQIQPDTITDNSGNTNKVTDLLVFNTLRKTDTETDATSGFLGSASNTNSKVKAIQRQNIDNVTFMNNIPSSIYDKSAKKIVNEDTTWDVSAMQDKSILAWYTTNANGSLKVYIGSDYEIFGNYNSSRLFSYIGASDKCTSKETITNINLLNVNSVYNMSYMFASTGKNAMTSLSLGDNFDTSSVDSMKSMFEDTGHTAMMTLELGGNFNTSNVTDMSKMFQGTGYVAMTGLDLGGKFNTSNVTDMHNMFHTTGYTELLSLKLGGSFDTGNVTDMSYMFYMTGRNKLSKLDLGKSFNTSQVTNMSYMFNWMGALTQLDLGELFNTSSVTDMSYMFQGTGYQKIISFNLGDKFDTSNVTNMKGMFYHFGQKLTTLDLGDKFYTTNVTDMSDMFYEAGSIDMTTLDFGPAFTKIASVNNGMFKDTGKDGAITILASEQIYLDRNNFKLNTDATDSAINYTRGTINPKYRTEWIKEASTLTIDDSDLKNSKITVTLRGRTNAEAGKDFKSNVTSSLTADKIHVYFDGVESTTVSKSLATAVEVKNATTGANDVTQVLTISGLDDVRKDGKSYTEWSGNISLKIDKKTLKDNTYSNQNLSAIDTSGTMTDIVIKETENIESNTNGTMFIDSIRPEFTYVYSDGNIDNDNKTLTVEFSVADKYFDSSTILNKVNDIVVKLIDTDPNVTIPNEKITKELTKIEDIKDTINGKEVTVGEKYKLVIKGLQQETADGKYRDYSGPMSISIPAGVATDKSGNENSGKTITIGVNDPGGNKDDEKIVDVVDPLWKTENINIDHTNNRVTVDLIGTDKYIDAVNSKLTTNDIKVYIDNEEVTTTTNVEKELSPVESLTETRDGKTVQYGVKYTLTLSNWEEATKQTAKNKEFFEWSGTTKIKIAEGTLKDQYTNTSKEQEFELGHVDFVKPKVEKVSSTPNASAKTETFVFNVIDKYFDESDLVTTNEISVYVDGELVPTTQITRTLTKVSDITGTVNGTSKVIGHQYKLVLSNLEQARSSIDYNREYSDWSGNFSIKIAEGAVKDTNTPTPNKNEETTIDGDFVDFIKPNVTYKYSTSDIDYDNKTFTMVFDITDKHFASSTLALKDLTIRVDGEEPNWDNDGAHGVVKELESTNIENVVNGTSKVVGKRYTLKLSHLEQLEKLVGKATMDYSGVITVAIPAEKVADTSANKNNAVTITSGIEVKGESTYGDIQLPNGNTVMAMGANPVGNNISGENAGMKLYSASISNENGVISSYDATNNTGNGYSNSTAKWIDLTGNNNGTINGATWGSDYLQFDGVDDWVNLGQINLTKQATLEVTLSVDSIQSGNKYVLNNFETGGAGIYLSSGYPKFQIYSSIQKKYISIQASTKLNVGEKTNIKGIYDGNQVYLYVNGKPVKGTIVDVVDPIWEKVSSSVNIKEQRATITVKGTDKFFENSNLTADKIKLIIDDEEVTEGVDIAVGTSTPVYTEDGTTRIGDEYTITVSGSGLNFSTSQVKIRIGTDTITDKSGNTNKTTDLILLTTLKETSTETEANSPFLGNTSIERQNIDNVTFMDNIPSSVYDVSTKELKDETAWDVSASQDKSIIAWYTTNDNGSLKVYIGSEDEIFGNVDSSYLFNCIGDSELCTSTQTITNIGLLNVGNVTNMNRMFRNTGYNAMTELDLGDNFDTSNVTNMSGMFERTGYCKMNTFNIGSNFKTNKVEDMSYMFMYTGAALMETLDLKDGFNTSAVKNMSYMFNLTGFSSMKTLKLGSDFDTGEVTNMSSMFAGTGHDSIETFYLGEKFKTNKVENMDSMFEEFGYKLLRSLDLGSSFDTSKVTSMNKMFYKTGHEKMTSLNLGDKFNTSAVKQMSAMFNETGFKLMESLDLGDKFYTTAVSNMNNMFDNTGATLMTTLDLGPAFTKIASTNTDMFKDTGKEGEAIIYASEQIYQDKNNFKLNTDATESAIEYTRGTINPKYRTEWIKEASELTIKDQDHLNESKISITLRGRTNAEAGKDFTSNVTSTLTADKIHVYFDGEEATDITKDIATATNTKNATTGANDVLQVITLSNLEETLRQKGKNYKEWSGNISLKIDKKTLKDTTYNNQNLQAIDTSGTMEDIVIKEAENISANKTGTMFADYIKPEFTYEYSNTTIDYGQKNVSVIFDVTDKYFKESTVSLENTTIQVDGVEPDWTKVTKILDKKILDADQTVGNIIYKANGDIYTTVNGEQQKIGERYELVLEGLETQNGEGYSGNVTLAFPEGVVTDQSNNKNSGKTITIGIDDPANDDHKDPVVVDVVNPLWSYGTSSINRVRDGAEADTVDVTIIGSDKYYSTNTLAIDKINVYVDDNLESSITKNLTEITDTATLKQLARKQGLADVNNLKLIGYKLTLGNFGKINGATKVVIDAGTIQDESGNKNIETTIPVGNSEWVEVGDSSANPIYPAFRDSIVDFVRPVIKYTYSAVEGETNPDIDYEAKTLTVKFTVTDKYIREDSIMNADGTLNANNIRIKVAGTDLTEQLHTTVTSQALADGTGTEYTFVVSNFELVYDEANKYQDYSGAVDFVFTEDKVDDTSGNKNSATTITLDYDDGDDTDNPVIVDVIDPLVERTTENLSILNANNAINRDLANETGTVSLRVRISDKYLDKALLQEPRNTLNMKVKVVKPDGETVYPETITKQVSQVSKQSTSVIYQIVLGVFGENEGVTSVIIPEGVVTDKYGNKNKETEVLVGNATWTESGDSNHQYTAFNNSIVDFTRPTWEYSTSSITRNRAEETGTVTVKILGRDKYYLNDILTEDKIFVYVDNTSNPDKPVTTITKKLTKITDTAQLDGADTGYILTLGNFGTYDGAVKISIADNTIRDTSGNGNKITEIPVGNPNWVETDISDSADNPKYTAFRNNIVDFIKPTIKYKYSEGANPVIDQDNKQVKITFDAVDTNFLESNILSADDIKQILVDDYDVTDTITKELTSSDITDDSGNGIRYTLTLSNFELESNLEDEIFRRHSGKIEFVIGSGMVRDTSGNTNIETKIIVDNDDGDDSDNYIRADFINPKIFYVDKFISYAQRYATVTIAGTDRFYDFNTKLTADDISIYTLNRENQYVQRTDFNLTVTPVKTEYGYNFVVRLNNFEEEFKQLKISIPAGKIGDLDGHTNEAIDIFVDLDNKKPTWKYVSTDTSRFESDGKINFTVKGQDTFLDIAKSNLTENNVKIYRDGTDVTNVDNITVNYVGSDDTELSKSYEIAVSGLTEIGTYSLVLEKNTLIDQFNNKSNTTTISFSKSALSANTDNYTAVTYYASPDFEQVHQAYVHELMSVNETGTNKESTIYRASSLGEIYDGGKNTLFAEPFKYSNGTQQAYSFKGWAEANEKGFSADDAKVYSLYEDIPNTVTHLNAIWQQATVIFVSKSGDDSNDGKSPDTPVKDLKTAYSKLNTDGTASTNIIVVMDKLEWNSSDKLTGNATITSLYAGVDYRTENDAELKISSNMDIEGDITFDNIKLYSNSTTVSDGSDYLANGDYSNVLITNYGDVTLGRGISTPDNKYTFGAIVGGNYKEETTKNTIGIHTVIVEAGKYNDIIIGSSLNNPSTTRKYVSHQVIIGTMKESTISRNEKLTITGYLAMGELEDRCYPYNRDGSQDTALGYTRYYAIAKIYSGLFTGENKFNKTSEDASIYLRSINGFNDGKIKFDMYGGNITGSIYGGSRMATTKDKNDARQPDANILNFYGGRITGDIFGHGNSDTSTGNSVIELQGCIDITGNIFGASNTATVAQGKVTGDTNITVDSSIIIKGNIYGGSKGVIENSTVNLNTGLITGNTNVTLNAGTVQGDIFGGGYNSGVTLAANVTINNGQLTGSIYGGSYQNQVRGAGNVKILGGTVNDVYGGNVLTSVNQLNADNTSEETVVTIGSTDKTTTPTVKGKIFGNGKFNRSGTVKVQLVKCATVPTVYGGSDGSGITNETYIYLKGMTASTIYGSSKDAGTTTKSFIFLQSGTVTDVYGGGYGGNTTTSNVQLEGTATATNVYGGANERGNVNTSNVDLISGNATNIFGAGNSVGTTVTNVTLNGMRVESIHGGSKWTGATGETNVVLNSGRVEYVYGAGYDVGATNTKVTQNGATAINIYGGCEGVRVSNSPEVTNSVVNINNAYVKNVYGGNMGSGTVKYATVNVSGNSTIAGKIFGGGYQSNIGWSGTDGSATVNITGGTFYNDVVGGSERGMAYGTTNVNIGKEAVTDNSLQAARIAIGGNIYGAGDAINPSYRETSLVGSSHVNMFNSVSSPIAFENSIFGSGNGANYEPKGSVDESTIKVKGFGSSASSHKMTSIERTGKAYIQSSYLELTGAQNEYNLYKNTSYTLNRITNGFALLDNSTLYTQRGFNMVGGFESLLSTGDNSTIKETATIANDQVTRNVDNRIYTFEGVNLILAKQEGDLADKYNQDIWGDVNGMAFFGMYRLNRSTGKKEYDVYAPESEEATSTNMFANGTYIEGRHKANHDYTVDGFYTNVDSGLGIIPQVIDVVDQGTYYDWIIGADIVNYSTLLTASTYSTYSMADLDLNFKEFVNNVSYNGTTFTVDRISANAFDAETNLINKLSIPTYSANANNNFALTMQTSNSTGWLKSGTTNLYTDSYGSFDGDKVYKTDNSTDAGSLRFKLFNSINVSETKDLGYVNIVLTGKARTGEDASTGKVFKVIIAVNIQSLYEEEVESYVPRFTDTTDVEATYTTDSAVDMTYVLYRTGIEGQSDIYTSGDYRVLSTTTPLPKGTKVTLRDYGQGDNVNKVYYYQVASDADYDATDNTSGSTRYLYKLSKFTDIGGTSSSAKYVDENSKYYHAGADEEGKGYALEKYDVSIDFMDSNLDTNKLAQETYLELRDSSGNKKLDNGDKTVQYNLFNQKAIMSESVITNGGNTSYSVFENLTIPFTFDSSLLEQKTNDGTNIQDTKYYSKKTGMAIELVDEHGERIKAPEVQNLRLTDNSDSTSYAAGSDGVIRVPLSDGCAKIKNSYSLSMSQSSVPAGQYIAKIYFFASDDGEYFGGEVTEVRELYITFINRKLGLAGLESVDGSRIINKETRVNLDGGDGLDLTVKIGSPTNDTNIRVELYKRNATYTTAEDGTTSYNGISYTKVDLKDYLQDLNGEEWKTPEDYTGQDLITADGCKEYMVMEKKSHQAPSQGENIEEIAFKKAIKEGIGTGEYKLVFKAYYENTVIQTIRKTFIVVP